MSYFTLLFHTKHSKSWVCLICTTHLNLDYSHFKIPGATFDLRLLYWTMRSRLFKKNNPDNYDIIWGKK